MKTDTKIFIILLIASVISSLLVIPYTFTLISQAAEPFFEIAVIQVLNSLIIYGILIYFGLKLARKVGLGLPILEAYLENKEVSSKLKPVLKISVGMGVLAGVLIIIFSQVFNFLDPEMAVQFADVIPPAWQGLLASFYGAINEEIALRLFFMSLLVWIFYKIKSTPEGKPTKTGFYLAIIIAAIVFGLGHLPVTADIVPLTSIVVARALVLNGIGGIIFGWLYWKKGLESAILAHFSADIVLHVILPLIALLGTSILI